VGDSKELLKAEFASPRERATWVYGLMRMVLDVPVPQRTATLAQITSAIDAHPEREKIRGALREFWSHHSYVRLISEAGLPDEAYLLRELVTRAFRHFMPSDEVGGDLYILMDSLGLKDEDAQWLATMPDTLVQWWGPIFQPPRASVVAACKLLALRTSEVALSRDVQAISNDDDLTRSPFFHLPRVVERAARHPEDSRRWQVVREACEAQLLASNETLEREGSSANLVFRLRLLRSLLWRIRQVLDLHSGEANARTFAVTVVHGFASQRQFSGLVTSTFRRLARSVVEKTGRAGTHYIARHSAQWRLMGGGAILAGVITSFTALFKYGIVKVIHPPLLVAIGHSLNYAISFLLMQAGGFLLASKMPAATAATLVDAMEDPSKDHMASIRAISQTQVIVTMGNLLGTVPTSIAIDRLWNYLFHHPYLNAAEAEHGVHMLIPHQSATIPFAIVTGVFLWLSSLATGWSANYIALNRMESAIQNSIRARERLGPHGAHRLAYWLKHHAPGSMGYIVLGFLLGAVPVVVTLFGIPLEVRHVTLAAGSLGYAVDSLWLSGQLDRADTILAFVGVLVTGILNITTSFFLSFLLAIRARNIHEKEAKNFAREVIREFLASPLSFMRPEER
jgi:site-specific recombinase